MKLFITALCVLLLLPATASAEDVKNDFLTDFLVGTYHLIGKFPDSEQPYYGKLTIDAPGGKLKISRTIQGETVDVVAALEPSEAVPEVTFLRMRFAEQGIDYESTCQIESDLDNYARVTCYRYRTDGSTESPGLEALFIDLEME